MTHTRHAVYLYELQVEPLYTYAARLSIRRQMRIRSHCWRYSRRSSGWGRRNPYTRPVPSGSYRQSSTETDSEAQYLEKHVSKI